MASLIGRTLGKYRLVARLGRGGMAEVYKAYQPGLNRYVSVKVLHTHMVDDKNFVGRFEREAQAVGKLRHPNIVQAFDFDHEDDLYFLAMEFIDGPTLKEELEARQAAGKPFSLKEIARIFSALCSAIDYAHARGMVHRDLKPANVMINPEGQVVLTDFGIARIMGATTFTQTGALSGTPHYMSPEQGQGQHGDERSDIYSLGVMLYELVTGAVPYDADTPFIVILKHIQEPIPPPRQMAPDLPLAVEQVIRKAMSKQPEDRYQQAGELAAALREAVGLAPAEVHLPLATVAPRRQIEEIDPTTGIFPLKEKTSPVAVRSSRGTLAVPQPGATVAQAAPARRAPLIPLLMGGSLLILLLLGGLMAGVWLLNRQDRATPAALDIAAVDNATAIALAQATATAAAQATAQAEATAAASNPPTQTALAATAQAEATASQQTAEARVMAVVQSALDSTATAQANQAATATAAVEQAQATQAAATQAAAQAAEAQATATSAAAAQSTQTAAAQAAQTAQAQATQTAAARPLAKTGVFNDFEFASTWRRGDQPNGTFERTTAETHQGNYSGQLSYQFPTPENDFVVFRWPQLLGGQPNQITAWVYGDGRGHFLNLWLEDSAGETWQFSFGQVKHQGWQQMTALISPAQPWPTTHIDGPGNNVVDYPVSFQALVLDDGSDDYSGSGVIYIDDLGSAAGPLPALPTPAPASAPASSLIFNADRTTLGAGECTLLSWGVENVSAVFLNGEGVPGQYSRQVCPTATTTYTLLVILKDGSTTSKAITITVQ